MLPSGIRQRGGIKGARAESHQNQLTRNADCQSVRQHVQHQPSADDKALPMVGQAIERLN
ncbi:MAG: hypothetical protein DVS81_03605 [Candidatus Accumulibacter meliphilus]|uniref:Uncharacterized protein n=1 Tax=Candidatus Accumulibacter meliphilus TaxID=2211374 RepID=A0A369XRK1_9PROT|nr:MAG: hypothetical protein DVS81_03605 [Candidatus Accumulibacter meliphilus]